MRRGTGRPEGRGHRWGRLGRLRTPPSAPPVDEPESTEPESDGPDPQATDQPATGRWLGVPGAPLNRQSPFLVGFVGAIGVFVAWGLVQATQRLSSVLTLLVVALFLALGLDPVVRAIQRRGPRRSVAVSVVFAVVIGIFVGVIALLVPPVVGEASQLADQAPRYVQNLLDARVVRDLDAQYGIVSRAQEELQRRATDQSLWTSLFGGVLGAGRAVVSGFFSAFTVLVLTLYFLASLNSVKTSVYHLVPASRRERVAHLGEEVSRRVGGYFLGQIAVATTNAVCSYLLMKVVGIPFAAVLAVTVGLLGLVPMVGATIGAVLVVVVALFQSGTAALVVGIYYVLYQQVENYVIAPRVMRRTVAVPGAVTVIAALAGGTLLGVLGAVLAIPVAAALLLVYQEVLVPRQAQH
jgi:predicted PurR-regulated permease PerM